MSQPETSNISAAIAAAIILGGTGLIFYYMPAMMMALSQTSPWLSYGLAITFVLAFFAVFWLRGKRQNRVARSSDESVAQPQSVKAEHQKSENSALQ